MIFDKEFVSHLTNYIGSNDYNSKKYLNAYFMKFLDIPQVNDGKKQIINQGYRFWNFSDYDILNFILGKSINIKQTGFLGYYSNISNTKNMIKFLNLKNSSKIFYLIEEKKDILLRIYTPLENIDNNDFNNEELTIINEVLDKYKIENEYVSINNPNYQLTFKNIKAMLIHERLSDLLNLKETHKFNNGYCYVLLNQENIEIIRCSEAFNYLINKKYMVNDFGAILLDKYYSNKFIEYYQEEDIEKNETEILNEIIDIKTPTKINFKVSS